MKHDSFESAGSAATAIAAAIINSFVMTHSIMVTVIATIAVLLAVLSHDGRSAAWRIVRDPEDGVHGSFPAACLVAGQPGGALSFSRSEAAGRWSQEKLLDSPCPSMS